MGLHYKMKRHRSDQIGLTICVSHLCHFDSSVAINSDGLNTGCDTVRRRSERLSLSSVSIDTEHERSVSDWPACRDTDRLFSTQMTLPWVGHKASFLS